MSLLTVRMRAETVQGPLPEYIIFNKQLQFLNKRKQKSFGLNVFLSA